MRAYISVSYSKRKIVENEISAITAVLNSYRIEAVVFVDKYNFQATQEKAMMHQAVLDIDDCDIFIAEVSDKAIGIGVEVGYAKAKNKPIVYVRRIDAEHSTTVSGVSDYNIIYKNVNGLKKSLSEILEKKFQEFNRCKLAEECDATQMP